MVMFRTGSDCLCGCEYRALLPRVAPSRFGPVRSVWLAQDVRERLAPAVYVLVRRKKLQLLP